MTIKLSAAMQRVLKRAPDDWRKIGYDIAAFPSIEALETRSLVKVRWQPNVDKAKAHLEWTITEAGKIVDGRIPA
jgi:hypothetical protein